MEVLLFANIVPTEHLFLHFVKWSRLFLNRWNENNSRHFGKKENFFATMNKTTVVCWKKSSTRNVHLRKATDSVFKTVDCSSSSSLIILGNAHLVSFSRLGPILVKVFWSKNLLHNDQTKGIFLIFFAKRQKWFHWFFDQTTWTKIGLSLVTY